MKRRKEEQQEEEILESIGLSILQNEELPIRSRIESYRTFLREYRRERIKQQINKFREINGFDPSDDDAKRKLVDELYYEVYQRYPSDDKERNKYTYSQQRVMNMMMIGWKPMVV